MQPKTNRTEQICISTVDGKLEKINIRNNTFTIYSSLSHVYPVVCKLSDGLLDDVKNALGRYVSVHGKCFYRPDASFPHRIEDCEMEVLPRSEDLPTWQDIYGMAPNMTGGLSSVEFVRQQRDKWDK